VCDPQLGHRTFPLRNSIRKHWLWRYTPANSSIHFPFRQIATLYPNPSWKKQPPHDESDNHALFIWNTNSLPKSGYITAGETCVSGHLFTSYMFLHTLFLIFSSRLWLLRILSAWIEWKWRKAVQKREARGDCPLGKGLNRIGLNGFGFWAFLRV